MSVIAQGHYVSNGLATATDIVSAIREGKIPGIRTVPNVGQDPRDQWYPGNDGVADVTELWAYYCARGDEIVSLRSQLADANEALTIAHGVGSAGRNDEVCALKELAKSLRFALRETAKFVGASIGPEASDMFHCMVPAEVNLVARKLERERDQAMAENGELRKLLDEASEFVGEVVTRNAAAWGAHLEYKQEPAITCLHRINAILATKAQGERT